MPSSQPFSQDTTFRLSYTGVAGDRAMPFKPIQKAMMGAGPMQTVTTQRHDYTPKPIIPTENYKPANALMPSDHKMEGTFYHFPDIVRSFGFLVQAFALQI